jgi:hypothetical protein
MRPANHVMLGTLRWAIAGAFAVACAVASAQPRYGLAPEALAVFDKWTLATCVGGEERALIEEMRRYRAPLTAAFQKAIVDGPPPDAVRDARAAAEERFAARAKFPLDDYRIEGVSKQDLDRFRRTSRQAYVDDQVRRFVTGYRANAVAGLAIVAGPASRDALSRIANNRADPLAPAAREAQRTVDRP